MFTRFGTTCPEPLREVAALLLSGSLEVLCTVVIDFVNMHRHGTVRYAAPSKYVLSPVLSRVRSHSPEGRKTSGSENGGTPSS